MKLTFTQIKQIISNGYDMNDIRDMLERMDDQPEWLTDMGEIDSISEIQAILQGGCASGAYMPAVRYYTARHTMCEHGDYVLEYIENQLGEVPQPDANESFSGICVHYLSIGVELWCQQFTDLLESVNWD